MVSLADFHFKISAHCTTIATKSQSKRQIGPLRRCTKNANYCHCMQEFSALVKTPPKENRSTKMCRTTQILSNTRRSFYSLCSTNSQESQNAPLFGSREIIVHKQQVVRKQMTAGDDFFSPVLECMW